MSEQQDADAYASVVAARDRAAALRALSDDDVVRALAGAASAHDPLLANVLATEALNRARYLEAAFTHLAEGVAVLGPRGTLLSMNPAAEAILGFKTRQVPQARFLELIEHFDQEHHAIPVAKDPIQRATADGLPSEGAGEYFRARSGRETCVTYACDPRVSDQGTPAGAVLAFHDCGARKQVERALATSRSVYRGLFENSPVPTVSVELDGTLIDANEAAVAITARPIAESRGRAFQAFVHPEDWPVVASMFEAVLRGRRSTGQLRILHRDGHAIHVDATGIPAIVDGEVVALHGFVRVRSQR